MKKHILIVLLLSACGQLKLDFVTEGFSIFSTTHLPKSTKGNTPITIGWSTNIPEEVHKIQTLQVQYRSQGSETWNPVGGGGTDIISGQVILDANTISTLGEGNFELGIIGTDIDGDDIELLLGSIIIDSSPPILNDISISVISGTRTNFSIPAATDTLPVHYNLVGAPTYGSLTGCLSSNANVQCTYTANTVSSNQVDTITYSGIDVHADPSITGSTSTSNGTITISVLEYGFPSGMTYFISMGGNNISSSGGTLGEQSFANIGYIPISPNNTSSSSSFIIDTLINSLF